MIAKNNEGKKLKITIYSLILIFFLPMVSDSQPIGMRPWKKEARCWRASELNLSPEQAKNLDLFQQTFLRETQLLRAQLLTRRIELRELLTNPANTTESIRNKHFEVVETQSKIEEKAIEYMMKVRSLLTQEQLKLWCPEQEFPFFQRTMPSYSPMGPMPHRKSLPPEE